MPAVDVGIVRTLGSPDGRAILRGLPAVRRARGDAPAGPAAQGGPRPRLRRRPADPAAAAGPGGGQVRRVRRRHALHRRRARAGLPARGRGDPRRAVLQRLAGDRARPRLRHRLGCRGDVGARRHRAGGRRRPGHRGDRRHQPAAVAGLAGPGGAGRGVRGAARPAALAGGRVARPGPPGPGRRPGGTGGSSGSSGSTRSSRRGSSCCRSRPPCPPPGPSCRRRCRTTPSRSAPRRSGPRSPARCSSAPCGGGRWPSGRGRSARILGADRSPIEVDETMAEPRDPDRRVARRPSAPWLYEPDRAVTQAGLLGAVTAATLGSEVDTGLGYVVSEAHVDVPFARRYAVREVMPFSVRSLRAWLRQHGITGLTIKKRGVRLDDDELRRQLRIGRKAGDGAQATVILTRVAGPAGRPRRRPRLTPARVQLSRPIPEASRSHRNRCGAKVKVPAPGEKVGRGSEVRGRAGRRGGAPPPRRPRGPRRAPASRSAPPREGCRERAAERVPGARGVDDLVAPPPRGPGASRRPRPPRCAPKVTSSERGSAPASASAAISCSLATTGSARATTSGGQGGIRRGVEHDARAPRPAARRTAVHTTARGTSSCTRSTSPGPRASTAATSRSSSRSLAPGITTIEFSPSSDTVTTACPVGTPAHDAHRRSMSMPRAARRAR